MLYGFAATAKPCPRVLSPGASLLAKYQEQGTECSEVTQGCLEDAQGCLEDAQGCLEDAQGCLEDAQGCLDKAKENLLLALKIAPELFESRYLLAQIFHQNQQWDKAIACYQHCLEQGDAVPQLHQNLADALYHKGELDEAETHYRVALALMPALAPALHGLAVLCHKQGDSERALDLYRKGLWRPQEMPSFITA